LRAGEGTGRRYRQPRRFEGAFRIFLPGAPNVAIAASGQLAVNEPARIIGKVPELLSGKGWYVEARTYFSGTAGKPLKEMRTIRSKFAVHQA
jgi:hypothetical protein